MKLKNEALQKLYGTIVKEPIFISPYGSSPIDKAFDECDEKLSESVTFEQLKNLQDRIDMLQQDHESDVRVIGKLHSQMVTLEDEKTEQEKRADNLSEQVEQLKKSRDIWFRNNGEKLAEIADLKNRLDKANYDRTALQQNLDYYMDIYKKVQDDYDELHRKYSECQGTVDKQAEQIRNLKDRLNNISNACGRTQDDIYGHGYEQGQTDLWVKLQDVKDMQPNEFDTECECLGDVIDMDLEDFLDTYKKWWEQKEIDRMRDYLERFCMGRLCYYCPLHTDGFNCSRGKWMAGIPDKDVKRYYEKAREEQKEIDRMRDWLTDFCYARVCEGCPLESKEYKCGCGYSFRKTDPSDLSIIPDKDIKRYYEKARGCGQYTLKDAKLFATTVEGVNRAITKACEGFCKAVRDADTKITENLRKGCTFEAEVKVDKDLVEKICGVKSEEKKSKPGELVITTRGVTTANYSEATMNAIKEAVRKFEKSLPALDSWESTITGSIKVDDILGNTDNTEHKFEYGDAVRLPWRDYDYMYIGPYEESKTLVRMFDPKMHAMVTSHIGNVKYNGGKIIICDEDDLRKIWKDKK